MCCGRICMLCTCLILLVIAVGLLFGFGVFKDGFHKIQETVRLQCDPRSGCGGGGGGGVGRRGYGFPDIYPELAQVITGSGLNKLQSVLRSRHQDCTAPGKQWYKLSDCFNATKNKLLAFSSDKDLNVPICQKATTCDLQRLFFTKLRKCKGFIEQKLC